jgi:hypothetical protein
VDNKKALALTSASENQVGENSAYEGLKRNFVRPRLALALALRRLF